MGKASKKTAPKGEVVAPAPAVAEKPLKKGKREAEEVIEKEVSKKKQKKKEAAAKEASVKKKAEVKTEKKKIVKKQESSDDSSSSESEEEQKVIEFTMNIFTGIVKATASVAAVKNGTAKNKVKDDSDSDSEDDNSEDDVPEAKKVAAAKTKSGPMKIDVDESSDDSESEDSSSDDDAPPKKAKTPFHPQPKKLGSKTLLMGNVSFDAEKADVDKFFEECGKVVDVHFATRRDGVRKGFADVEFATVEAAQKALVEKNGQSLAGRVVSLDFAVESGPYTPRRRLTVKRYLGRFDVVGRTGGGINDCGRRAGCFDGRCGDRGGGRGSLSGTGEKTIPTFGDD